MIKKKFLIFNWKMNGEKSYAIQIKDRLNNINDEDGEKFHIIVCPPIIFSNFFNSEKLTYSIGSQNCASEKDGAYTGEISAKMLKEIGIKYVIIGHSERKKYFHEDEYIILKKMNIAIDNNLIPIVCVSNFNDNEKYLIDIIDNFVYNDLSKDLIIAYEPESSIGSGIVDSVYSIENNILNIKNLFKDYVIKNKNIYVVYGGSVNDKNFLDILKVSDGVLIGKASLDYEAFDNFLKKI
jgi:triosephosphate isomerase